jgi:predicted nucleotidyltransferase
VETEPTVLTPPITDELLREIVARIVRRLPDCCVVLFGSHANGDARQGSDVDLLVVAETDQDPLALAGELYCLLRPRTFPLDVVVMTPEELQARRNGFDTFIREVLRRGRVLHGRLP